MFDSEIRAVMKTDMDWWNSLSDTEKNEIYTCERTKDEFYEYGIEYNAWFEHINDSRKQIIRIYY